MSEEEKSKILQQAVEDIGEFDHLIEAFKSIRFKFQLKISEANWHQLLRHRTIVFDYSEPTIENGFVIPPNIEKANASEILIEAIKASEELFIELKEKLPEVSPYVVTNAHKRLVLMNADLWAFDHFANLRCTNEAQWDIRNVSFKMLDLIKEVAPQLTTFMARRKKSLKDGDEIMKTSFKEISLPKLNNLTPSLESTALKLMEEAGELAQAIGKFRGLNGENVTLSEKEIMEKISEELLDVAQVAVSMMFVLEEKYNINIEEKLKEHIEKLKRKGYIK